VLTKHVVKAHMKTCSCLEWQHTGKPCEHALVVTIVQQFRDVGIENFIDDYFSVEKFKKSYGRLMEELGDRSLWPKVYIGFHVSAPIGRRKVGRQRKDRMPRN
jgi:hypothetical protein